jgi:hypothetical protein
MLYRVIKQKGETMSKRTVKDLIDKQKENEKRTKSEKAAAERKKKVNK